MLCAAIDIGSNTTRVLVAEPVEGQLKKVMEQRAYTRINKALDEDGSIRRGEGRRGRRGRRDPGSAGAGAGSRGRFAPSLRPRCAMPATARLRRRRSPRPPAFAVDILSDEQEGDSPSSARPRRSAIRCPGQDRSRRRRRRLDRGYSRHRRGRGRARRSWRVGSGVLADELISSDPPSVAEIRKVRDRIDDIFAGRRYRAPGAGGRGRRQRHLVATPGRRGARV